MVGEGLFSGRRYGVREADVIKGLSFFSSSFVPKEL